MNDNKNESISRRQFVGTSAAAAASVMIVPRHVLGMGYQAPSDRLNVAGVGFGGMGRGNLERVESENIIALCDVDDEYARETFERYPKAKRFKDYREMFDAVPDIEAVIVATPDHTHAMIAMEAMRRKKHVYVQKPLTHDVYEARMLTEAAVEHDVVTQMGNQGHSGEGIRLIKEWVADGAIGNVTEVKTWTNRPIWPQGIDRPEETPATPSGLDWDRYLGPAPTRPYHPSYHPFTWRGWWDFGTGALGDMACHIMDAPFAALGLGHPTSVQASSSPVNSETGPLASIVRYEFPQRGEMPPLKFTWYDGGLMPERPEGLEPGRRMDDGGGGLLIGDEGTLMFGTYAEEPRLIPEVKMQDYTRPAKTLPRRTAANHEMEWAEACKDRSKKVSSPFSIAGPLTEFILLGNVAIRSETQEKLLWDGENMRVTNLPEANQYVRREYREGWKL